MSLEVSKAGFVHLLHLVKHPCANEASLPGCRFRAPLQTSTNPSKTWAVAIKSAGTWGFKAGSNAGNSTKSFAAFAALERGRQHKNALEVSQKSLHVYWGSAAAPCLNSERFRSLPQGPADLSPAGS